MKRTVNNPLAILTADWHLREDVPVCRTDDFIAAQWDKVKFIADLQEEYRCPVLHAGDLFHHWKPSPRLLSLCIQHLPQMFYTVYGNHDLPQHNVELKDKSGIYTLEIAKRITTIGCHWNETPTMEHAFRLGGLNVLLWHVMTYQDEEPYPGCPAPKSHQLLKKYKEFDVIVTGDNHQPFVVNDRGDQESIWIGKLTGRALINPGCLSRQTADLTDFKPRVYILSHTGVKPVYLPIKSGVISREHLQRKEDRDKRIDAFINRLSDDWKVALSFEENLRRFAEVNQVRTSVMDLIWKAIEGRIV